MKLFEIDQAILDCVDQETGEILDPDMLEDLQMQFDRKVENIALWVKNLTAEAGAIKEEKVAMAARQKSKESKIKGLKNFLAYILNGNEFETPKVKLSFRSSQRTEVFDETKIPDKYKIPQPPKIDTDGIKKALKRGEIVPGAKLVDAQNIQIK